MADILLLSRPQATGNGGSTTTPATDADIGAIGGLRRATSGSAVLYTDNLVTTIDIGGGTSVTNIGISAGAANDLTLTARGASITLNESGQTALDANFTATSIVGVLNELNEQDVQFAIFGPATAVATGDGAHIFTIPPGMAGLNLLRAQATVAVVGATGPTTVMIHNATDSNDMLSTPISIASATLTGTEGVVNAIFDDVALWDQIRIDVDTVSGTPPTGLNVILTFGL